MMRRLWKAVLFHGTHPPTNMEISGFAVLVIGWVMRRGTNEILDTLSWWVIRIGAGLVAFSVFRAGRREKEKEAEPKSGGDGDE